MSTTTSTFNFGSTFKSAVKRGTPASTVVWNIAQKTGKSETFVWNWLFKNGFVNRRKFGSNFIYWPNFDFNAKSNQNNKVFSFQQFVNWAIASGYCTPQQISGLKSQNDFINFFGPFFANQFGWNVSSGWTASKVKSFNVNGAGRSASHTANRARRTSSNNAKPARRTSVKRTRTNATRTFKFPKTAGVRAIRKAA